MSEYSFLSNPELLLSHSEFVRALARSLLFDENEVDEVVQKTWLAAIQSPPRNAGSEKAWLSRVVRNQAAEVQRKEIRIDQREKISAKSEELASTAEIVERESARREVIDTVLNLEEPHRTAILLRFYEDLPPRAIAKQLGVPVETVRTRIKRGLELLREKLDRNHGGDRRAWCLAIIPFAAKSKAAQAAALGGISASIIGGVIMSLKTKIAAALLLATVGIGFFWMSTKPTTDPLPESAKQTSTTASAPKEERVAAVSADKETVAPPAAPALTEVQTPSPRSEISAISQKKPLLWGKIQNEKTGVALAGAKLVLVGFRNFEEKPNALPRLFRGESRQEFTANSEGIYRVQTLEEGLYFIVSPSQKDFAFTLATILFVGENAAKNFRNSSFLEPTNYQLTHLGIPAPKILTLEVNESTEENVSLRQGGKIEGKVLSSTGAPIAGAQIVALPAATLHAFDNGELYAGMSFGDLLGSMRKSLDAFFTETKSSSDGSFVITGTHEKVGLVASASKYFLSEAFTEAPPGSTQKVELVLKPNPTQGSIRGKVIDEHGEAVANAKVYLGDSSLLWNLDLSFTCADLDNLDRRVVISGKDGGFAFEKIPGTSKSSWDSKNESEKPLELIAVSRDLQIGRSTPIQASNLPVENVVIQISSSSKLAGTIVDNDTNLPIPNASIEALCNLRPGHGFYLHKYDQQTTDSKGRFQISGEILSGQEMLMNVSAQGYYKANFGIRAEKGKWFSDETITLAVAESSSQNKLFAEKEILIRLKRISWVIEGSVLSTTGSPAPRFGRRGNISTELFNLKAYKKDPSKDPRSTTYADEFIQSYDSQTGQFQFVVPENWPKDQIWIVLSTFDGQGLIVQEVRPNSEAVRFVTDPKLDDSIVSLSLRITDRLKGTNLSKKMLRLFTSKRGGDGQLDIVETYTADDELVYAKLKNGNYDVIVNVIGGGYGYGVIDNVELPPASEIGPFSIALDPEAKIRLNLETSNAAKTDSVTIAISDSANRIIWANTISPSKQSFLIPGLAAGSYTVKVLDEKMRESSSAKLEVAEGEEKILSLSLP